MISISDGRTYSELTFSDPNPAKRLLQRSRLAHAMKMARLAQVPRVILDFGAGNGELCKLLRVSYPHSTIHCYEPLPTFMKEAKENLSDTGGIEFLSQLDALEAGGVDLTFCLHVLEHLPMKDLTAAIGGIARILSQDGYLVVGVPIETGIPALYKGMFRMSRRYGAFDATLKNILACAIGRPPLERPEKEIGDGMSYHAYHVGFDHRRFQSTLSANFNVEAVSAAPIPILGEYINPEVYFLARKLSGSGRQV
jgi:trans-aconitate methyltransferase